MTFQGRPLNWKKSFMVFLLASWRTVNKMQEYFFLNYGNTFMSLCSTLFERLHCLTQICDHSTLLQLLHSKQIWYCSKLFSQFWTFFNSYQPISCASVYQACLRFGEMKSIWGYFSSEKLLLNPIFVLHMSY